MDISAAIGAFQGDSALIVGVLLGLLATSVLIVRDTVRRATTVRWRRDVTAAS